MTAENPANAEPCAAEGAVGFDGFEEVVGAGGGVAAAGGGAGDDLQHRVEEPLVEADEEADEPDGGAGDHGGASVGVKSPSRLACWSQSLESSAKVARQAPGRAMVMRKRR